MKLFRMLLAFALLSPSSAFACSCMMPGPVTSENLENTIVLRGVMVEQELDESKVELGGEIFVTPFPEARSTFDIRHLYFADPDLASDLDGDAVTLTHSLSSASCGRSFEKGQSVFVVAQHWRGRMTASLCEPFTEQAVVEDLAKPTSFIKTLDADR